MLHFLYLKHLALTGKPLGVNYFLISWRAVVCTFYPRISKGVVSVSLVHLFWNFNFFPANYLINSQRTRPDVQSTPGEKVLRHSPAREYFGHSVFSPMTCQSGREWFGNRGEAKGKPLMNFIIKPHHKALLFDRTFHFVFSLPARRRATNNNSLEPSCKWLSWDRGRVLILLA